MATLKEIFEGNTADILEATELLKVLGDREGQFVWKKYKITKKTVTDPVLKLVGTNPIKASVEGADLTQVDESFFDMFGYNGTYDTFYFHYDNGVLYFYASGTNHVVTYNPSTTELSMPTFNGGFNANERWTYTGDKVVSVSEFVSFVTADIEDAYPNGGELDGYWYELLKEGASGIDFGTFSVTTWSTDVTVAHRLGVIPSKVYVIGNGLDVHSANSYATVILASNVPVVNDTYPVYGYTATANGNAAQRISNASYISATAETITMLDVGSQVASASYTWVAIA